MFILPLFFGISFVSCVVLVSALGNQGPEEIK